MYFIYKYLLLERKKFFISLHCDKKKSINLNKKKEWQI